MSSGIIMREAHFKGRAPIDAYGNGGFRFAGMSHRGSVLCLPDSIQAWPPVSADAITLEHFALLLVEGADVEILLIGTGLEPHPLAKGLRQAMRDAGLKADIMTTGSAVRTFNVLIEEERRVAAALIAV
jgi:uncharacterized protein